RGSFLKAVGAGTYRTWSGRDRIVVSDLRDTLHIVGGQEIVTSDNLAIKATAMLRLHIVDARRAHEAAQDGLQVIHALAQAAIRRSALQRSLDEALATRGEIGLEIATDLKPRLAELGYELIAADIRYPMLTTETKKAFADVFRARKEGEAALERARGETAALRNLAN